MRGMRRGVRGRARVALLLPVLVVAIVLVTAGVALADQWSDISDSTWVNTYGVTAAQAATVSDGYTDGTFRPRQSVTRGQFAKFVVDGFGIATLSPATPTFSDVGRSNTFYKWIEGGYAARVLSGFTDGTYRPNSTISRQQCNNILGSYLSSKELSQKGVITGSKSTYGSLSAWYAAEGPAILAAFKDATSVAAVHAPGTAYLVFRDVVQGSNGNLTPASNLTRAQAVVLILRVEAATFGGGTGAAPTVSLVNPAAGPAAGGNAVAITGVNFTGVTAVKFGTTNATSFTIGSSTSLMAIAPAGTAGTTVDVTVTNAGGTSATGANTKYSYGPPTITKLEPNGGSAAGGTAVTITGTGFTSVTYVRFGNNVAASFVVLNPTTITAVSPAGTLATTVDVVVTTLAGSSAVSDASKFTYGVPTITKLTPAAGPAAGGTSVVITGTGFTQISGAAGVKFGTVNATSYVVNSTTQITAVAPAGTEGTTVDVVVTNSVGASGISLNSKYSYGVPKITSINPTGGTEAGGTLVAITGTGFTGVSAVKFGTVNAKSFTVLSATEMTATSPAGTIGTTVDISVTTPAGTNPNTTADDFTYGLPTVTLLSPAAGPPAGGNTVIITGTNFTGVTKVMFGNKPANSYAVNSKTQITAVAPYGTTGETVDVIVTTGAGSSPSVLASKYSYGAPKIISLSPTGGSAAGGTTVTITGEGFTGVTAVKFGATDASFTVVSPVTITAVSPAGALDSTVDVTVVNPQGTSLTGSATKYSYIGAPTVTSISPSSGVAGTDVTITGTYFIKGSTTVKFGTVSATILSTNDAATQIVVDAPSGVTSGTTVDVRVSNSVGTSPNTAADDFTYGVPIVTELNPAAGPNGGGSTVIITGSAFVNVTKVGFVWNSDTPDDPSDDVEYLATIVGSYTSSQITVTAPDAPLAVNKTVDVRVTNAVGTSATSAATKYSYGVPIITKLEPTGGPTAGGTTVIITGTGFTGLSGAVAVRFGLVAATSYTVNSPTQITAVAPAHAAGQVDVYVTNPTGTSADVDASNYTYGGPVITSVSPAAGPAAGGNSVVITGTGFAGVTGAGGVKFGLVSLTEDTGGSFLAGEYKVDSATQITAKPAGGPSGTTVDVSVTNGGLTSVNTPADDYAYGAPTVTVLDPNGGPALGGNEVVITGSGFAGVSSVMFGSKSVSASYYAVDSPTQITVESAPSGTGTVDVTVTNPAGTSATGPASKYTYGVPTVSKVEPAAGSADGGNNVVITGTNFTGITYATYPNAVMFGAQAATSYTVNSTTQITAKAPDGPNNTAVAVTVTTPNGTSAISVAPDLRTWYTFGVPKVTSVVPGGGPAGGGNQVVINGDGFTGLISVKFGTTAVSSSYFTVDSPIKITVTSVPAGSGTVDVTVTNPVGASSTTGTGNDYSYALPAVTNVSPVAGPTTGGTLVTITGNNFTGISGADGVQFGTTNATSYTVINSTVISAIAPPHAQGTIDVRVKNGAGQSATSAASKYSYGKPIITSLDPNTGDPDGGETVVITGDGFTGVTKVEFDGDALPTSAYTVDSPTQITVTDTPAGDPGDVVGVVVFNPEGGSNVALFSYGLPTVTRLTPAAGDSAGGTEVVITGTGFTGVAAVKFGGVNATSYIVDATTQIRAVAPGGTNNTWVHVTVQTAAGTSLTSTASQYAYGKGRVTNVTPAAGPAAGGNTVVLTGTGFTGDPVVRVDGDVLSESDYEVNAPTQITITDMPAGTAGENVEISVTNDYDSAGTKGYYTYGIPVVTSVVPAAGPAGGGNTVVINGKGFLSVETAVGDGAVRFGTAGVDAADYSVNAAGTVITVTSVPAGTEFTTVDVYVTNPAGTSVSSDATADTMDSSKYSYGIPRVLSVSPAAGSASGGNTVTITGTGFTGVTGAASVKFGGTNATSYVVNSPTEITAVAPPGTEFTTVDVYVTNPFGTSVSSDATASTTDSSKYSYGEPKVTSLTPAEGHSSGGTVVIIVGKGFTGVTAVRFGSKAALEFTVIDDTHIIATAPSGTADSWVDVRVTNPVGESSTSGAGNDYHYLP